MVLIATDLPEPVVPAISACGIFAKSATTGSPAISLPSDKVSGDLELSYFSERSISLKNTISRCSLGISIPIVGRPGITSTTRTERTDNARAKSVDKFVTLLAFVPGARFNSYNATTGPG